MEDIKLMVFSGGNYVLYLVVCADVSLHQENCMKRLSGLILVYKCGKAEEITLIKKLKIFNSFYYSWMKVDPLCISSSFLSHLIHCGHFILRLSFYFMSYTHCFLGGHFVLLHWKQTNTFLPCIMSQGMKVHLHLISMT